MSYCRTRLFGARIALLEHGESNRLKAQMPHRLHPNSQCGSVGARVILMDGRGNTMCRDWSGRSDWSSLQGVPVPQLLPREYSGPRHRVKVGQRPDGRCEYEERPGAAPPNQGGGKDENVMRIYFVRAQEIGSEIR